MCHNTLSWYSYSGRGFTEGDSSSVWLDDDGNATSVLWGGPSCASGTARITATLVKESSSTTTTFKVRPPVRTKEGITGVPATEVEDSTHSGAVFVFEIEFPRCTPIAR